MIESADAIAPGFVNAHTHLYSGLVPLGMPAPEPAPDNFLQILERVWWRLDRALDEASIRASAELYVAEAIEFGTVGLIDHHESPSFIEGSLDVIADVCQRLGMPAVLCYGATERNGGQGEARLGLQECRRFITDNARPLVRGVVGLHASFTVSDQTIRDAAAMARELGTVLHVHVAEDAADVVDARKRGFAGVVDRFAKLDALVAGSIFAHGIHLSRAEVKQCAASDCWFVQNPRSNKGNQVGYARALAATNRVALGTDGYPADMQAENRALLEEAAAHGDPPDSVAGRLAAGHTVLARWFAEGLGGRLAPDRSAAREALPQIRDRANAEAVALWSRMRQL